MPEEVQNQNASGDGGISGGGGPGYRHLTNESEKFLTTF